MMPSRNRPWMTSSILSTLKALTARVSGVARRAHHAGARDDHQHDRGRGDPEPEDARADERGETDDRQEPAPADHELPARPPEGVNDEPNDALEREQHQRRELEEYPVLLPHGDDDQDDQHDEMPDECADEGRPAGATLHAGPLRAATLSRSTSVPADPRPDEGRRRVEDDVRCNQGHPAKR